MFKFIKSLFSNKVPNCCMQEDIIKGILMQKNYVPHKFAPPVSPKYLPPKFSLPVSPNDVTYKINVPLQNLRRSASSTNLNV